MTTIMRRVLILVAAALTVAGAQSQTLARQGWAGSGIQVQPWYRQAVFYQIDPISFSDSNADGFGDLRGITAHLDYVESLNVDAVVLSPLALEPAYAEHGTGPAFDPVYGDLDDLDQLIAAASSHHLRVLVDLWLDQARTPAEAGTTARFWLARGVAGLHVAATASGGQARAESGQTMSAAELAARLEEVRRVVAATAGQRLLLLEPLTATGMAAPQTSRRHVQRTAGLAGPHPAELDLPRTPLLPATLNAVNLADAVTRANAVGSATASALMTDSPDRARSFDRYAAITAPGGLAAVDALARTLAMTLLTLPATPVLYFGQELGMGTTPVRAGAAPAGSPRVIEAGDAGEPTPMQWGSGPDTMNGFSTGTPWIGMGSNAITSNVASEDAAPASLLNWYRRLDRLRHTQASLRDGGFVILRTKTPGVVGWIRLGAKTGGTPSAPVLVLVNLSAKASVISLTEALRQIAPLARGASAAQTVHTLARSDDAIIQLVGAQLTIPLDHIVLPAFGCYAGELTTQRGLESVATPVRRSRRSGR